MVQTERSIRAAASEGLPMVLLINKMDRLILVIFVASMRNYLLCRN